MHECYEPRDQIFYLNLIRVNMENLHRVFIAVSVPPVDRLHHDTFRLFIAFSFALP